MTAEAREAASALAAELAAEIGRLRHSTATELSDAALASAILRLPALRKVTDLALAEAEDEVMGRIKVIGAVELARAAEAGALAERERAAPLLAAYRRLYDAWWNQGATVEIDLKGYNGISYEDTNALDEAAGRIEALLKGGEA